MIRGGLVIGILGGVLLFLPFGLIVAVPMIALGGILLLIGFLSNTAKAGVGIGKMAATAATTKPCPQCATKMAKAATLCLTCGYREPAQEPAVV